MEEMKVRMGNRIRELRKEKGISQAGLARVLKMSASYLAMIEGGKRIPSVELLLMIAKKLDVSVDELLYGKKEGMVIDRQHGTRKQKEKERDLERSKTAKDEKQKT